MLQFAGINFSVDHHDILESLREQSFNLFCVNNTPSMSDALQFISICNNHRNENVELNNSSGIIFLINDKLHSDLTCESIKEYFPNKKSFMIVFESTIEDYERKIFWKISKMASIFSFYLDGDDSKTFIDYFMNFIIGEITEGRSGVVKNCESTENLWITDICNKSNSNLLSVAILERNYGIVNYLLSFRLIPLEHRDNNEYRAIDYLWEEFINEQDDDKKAILNGLILRFLERNSKFPEKSYKINKISFKDNGISADIKDFIEKCETYHELIEKMQSDADRKILEANLRSELGNDEDLHFFYTTNNQSLLAHATKLNDYDTAYMLWSRSIELDYKEDSSIFNKLQHLIRDNALSHHINHLTVLFAMSKIANNHIDAKKCWKYITRAYKLLDKDKSCSIILKVVAAWRNLTILFDFEHDHILHVDPRSSKSTGGNTYPYGVINIGAKYLLDETKKYEVFGVMMHEFCHLAVLKTYMNNWEPYPVGDSDDKTDYLTKVLPQCDKNKDKEIIVRWVYAYPKNEQSCEIIVRAVHMTMHYFGQDEKINENRATFSELFKYHENNLKKDLIDAVEMLNILQDIRRELNFDKLTEPMKAKVLFGKNIIFDGCGIVGDIKTSFFEMVGNNPEILNLLTATEIRDILLRNTCLTLGSVCELKPEYKTIERKFIDYGIKADVLAAGSIECQKHVRTFEDVQSEAEKSKIFLLADTAGSGKTTTFYELARKLKKNYPSFWVSYIKMREHRKYFEDLDTDDLNISNILELMLKILNFKKKIQVVLFKKLFQMNKVIFLFDGFDEVSPKYNEFFMRLFKMLSINTMNSLWISTRPQHIDQLKRIFSQKVYKFVSYTIEEKMDFVELILKKIKKITKDKVVGLKAELKSFFTLLEGRSDGQYYVNNPLLIKLITELFADGCIDLKEFNLFKTLSNLFKKHGNEIDGKVDQSERTHFDYFSIVDVYQCFALEYLFGDSEKKYNLRLRDLPLMTRWEEEQIKIVDGKMKWTAGMIQRYGIMNVDLNADTEYDRNSVDFLHKMYAEYLVAQFIIKSVFEGPMEDPMNIFKLILIVASESNEFKVVQDFLLDYLKHKNDSAIFHDSMSTELTENLQMVHKRILGFKNIDYGMLTDSIEFWNEFLSDDLREIFWNLEKSDNFLKKILLRKRLENRKILKKILDILENTFGTNWNENFNTKNKQLITDSDANDIARDDNKFNKNFLKLLDLVEKNYEVYEIISFYEMYVAELRTLNALSGNVRREIFKRGSKVFNNNQDDFIEIAVKFIDCERNSENLEFYEQKCKEVFEDYPMYLGMIRENILNRKLLSL